MPKSFRSEPPKASKQQHRNPPPRNSSHRRAPPPQQRRSHDNQQHYARHAEDYRQRPNDSYHRSPDRRDRDYNSHHRDERHGRRKDRNDESDEDYYRSRSGHHHRSSRHRREDEDEKRSSSKKKRGSRHEDSSHREDDRRSHGSRDPPQNAKTITPYPGTELLTQATIFGRLTTPISLRLSSSLGRQRDMGTHFIVPRQIHRFRTYFVRSTLNSVATEAGVPTAHFTCDHLAFARFHRGAGRGCRDGFKIQFRPQLTTQRRQTARTGPKHKSQAKQARMTSQDTTYDVLYYKRTQKVHKSRGVSKMDGVLSFTHGTGRVVLCSADAMDQDDDSASSEEETKKLSWKEKQKKRKRSKSSSSSPTVYSGIQHIAVTVDTTIQLGGYEVEVISLRDMSTQQDKPLSKPTGFPYQKKLMVPRKRMIQQQRPLQPKKLPAQPKRVPSSTPTIPKAWPYKKRIDGASVSVQPAMRSASRPRQPLVGTQGQGAKTASSATLPHIPLPESIRSVLRPHQVTGVDFLWKTLKEKHGCILGDGETILTPLWQSNSLVFVVPAEMGLGKTLMTISCIVALHRTQREKVRTWTC